MKLIELMAHDNSEKLMFTLLTYLTILVVMLTYSFILIHYSDLFIQKRCQWLAMFYIYECHKWFYQKTPKRSTQYLKAF